MWTLFSAGSAGFPGYTRIYMLSPHSRLNMGVIGVSILRFMLTAIRFTYSTRFRPSSFSSTGQEAYPTFQIEQ
jgi:hypothetical protein